MLFDWSSFVHLGLGFVHIVEVSCGSAQTAPDQLDPLHVLPLQLEPDQLLPDHVEPLQELPLQLLPDKLEPDQLLPFQVPPLHELPAASVAAMALESKGWPMMSCSPVSATPSCTSRSEPRAASREPVPVEAAHAWADWGVEAARAASRLTRPAPWARTKAPGRGCAVCVTIALTWSGLRVGRCCKRSATTPETTAVACEVPL